MKKNKLFILLCCIVFLVRSACAETLVVGVGEGFAEAAPALADKVNQALLDSGLEIETRTLPAERCLQMAGHGEIAIDAGRIPSAVTEFPDLIRIEPSYSTINYWLVSPGKANCMLSAEERAQLPIVGLLGYRYFKNLVFPRFQNPVEVSNISELVNLLQNGRAVFTVLQQGHIDYVEDQVGLKLSTCDSEPFISMPVHSYIHKNYAWAIPKLEAAYQRAFGEPRELSQ